MDLRNGKDVDIWRWQEGTPGESPLVRENATSKRREAGHLRPALKQRGFDLSEH